MTSSPTTPTGAALTLAVGIPTRGRAAILKETLADLARQTRVPDAIFVVYYEPGDVGDAPGLFPHVHFIQGRGTGGSCSQRNHLLDAAGDNFDLIFIQDDDFFAHPEYLERMVEAFVRDGQVVGATGILLHNGATGAGHTVEFARGVLGGIGRAPTYDEKPPYKAFNTDGCNMAFRLAVVRKHRVRFDETMPGYAWYEDIDFSRRLLPYGTLVWVPGARGIHLGAKVGKTSGVRYGYSQIANPIYLCRKGSYPFPNAVQSIVKNLLANAAKSLRPEPYIDRRGRLGGNLRGFRDLLMGRLHPGRIVHL